MALDKAKLVEELSNATVLEIADLVKDLEAKWGVSAAAPVAAASAGPAGGGAAAAPAEAKTAFDVILASVPADKKIAVIKAVREVKAGLGLAWKPRHWSKALRSLCWKPPRRRRLTRRKRNLKMQAARLK